jgi:hypothetical protein
LVDNGEFLKTVILGNQRLTIGVALKHVIGWRVHRRSATSWKAWDIPLPWLRSIGYVLQRAGRTCPPFRLEPPATTPVYPGPRAHFSNHIHQLDLVGPRYLKGSRARYYCLVYKDVCDLTPFIGFFRASAKCAHTQSMK